jgi:1-deoxy-D-xylulose 5-phosphate reductoisomerase
VAVRSFLEERISFLDILVVVQESIEYVSKSIQIRSNHKMKVKDIFEVDNEARIKTDEIIEMRH